MTKFFIVIETNNSTPYALVVHNSLNVKSYPLSQSADEWAKWVNNENHEVEEIVSSLGLNLEFGDSQSISAKTLEPFKDVLPEPVYNFVKTLSNQQTIEFVDNVRGYGRRYVVESDIIQRKQHQRIETKSLNPLGDDSILKRQAYIDRKAMTFRSDNTFSELAFNLKAARAMWDPDLGPSGGWRCPAGSRYGGYITDRFGRGCGGGIIRRVGRALVNAGRGLDNLADRRDRRRLNRAAERAMKPRGVGARNRAERVAAGLERGARRVLQGDELQADVANRRVRRNIDRPAVRPERPRGGAIRPNVPGGGERPQRRPGSRPVRRSVTENRGRGGEVGRRIGPRPERDQSRYAPGWKPGEYKPGDKNRIAQRENRYAKVTTDQLYRALELNAPRDLKPGESADVEARRRQERLEILQELINRDLDVPERYKREAKIYRLKKQRKQGAKPKRNERVAQALERAARRIVGGEGGRSREERRQQRRERRAQRRERMAMALERGAQRVLGGEGNRPEQRRERAARALERGAERVVGGESKRPRSQRERARSAIVEQAQQSAVKKPQRKRRDVGFNALAGKDNLDDDFRQLLLGDWNDLADEWRKRLGPNAGGAVLTREAMDKYIADREGIRPPAFIGALKAKANDWEVIRDYFDAVRKNGGKDITGEERLAILEKLGPTRKRKLRERMAEKIEKPKTRTPRNKPLPPPPPPRGPRTPAARNVPPKVDVDNGGVIPAIAREPKREQLVKPFAPLPDEPGQIPEVRPIDNPKIKTLQQAKDYFDNGGELTDIPQQFWHQVISSNAGRNDEKRRVALIQRNGGAIKTVEVYALIGQQQGYVFNRGKRVDNEGLNEVMAQNFMVGLGLNLAPARVDGNDGSADPTKVWAAMPFAWNFAPPGVAQAGAGSNYKRGNLRKLPDKAVKERLAAMIASYSLGIVDRHSNNTMADVFTDENGIKRPYVAPIDLGWFGRGQKDFFKYAANSGSEFYDGYGMDTDIFDDIKSVLEPNRPGALSVNERVQLHKDLLDIYDQMAERARIMTQMTRADFISQQKANFSDKGLGLSPQQLVAWEREVEELARIGYDRLVLARQELQSRRNEFIQDVLGGSEVV